MDTWWGRTATTSIFIVAAITDWLDGYIARKVHLLKPSAEINGGHLLCSLFLGEILHGYKT